MRRLLPYAWFALAGILVIARFLSITPIMDSSSATGLIFSQIVGAVTSDLIVIAFGLIYLLVFKTTQSKSVLILGWLYIVFFATAHMASIILTFQRAQLLALEETYLRGEYLILTLTVGISFFAANIIFIAVLIVAISQAPKLIRTEAFD